MGLFGFGKNKNKSSSKENKKSKSNEIKAPVLFDNEKFEKIMSNICFDGEYSDFGVKIGETLSEVITPKIISDNRVRLFLSLKNYKTEDLIFKASEAAQGITGKQYKQDCARYSGELTCKFISDSDRELEIARFYCLDLYAKDYIEFWRMLQVYALLGSKSNEEYLKYLSIYDRLEQSLFAVDVSKEKICNSLKKSIIMSYNLKLNEKERVKKQLQNFINEISLEYEISEDTWTAIYKYLNGVVTSGLKLKLDEKDIQLGFGFKVESAEVKKVVLEKHSTIADMNKIFPNNKKVANEEKLITEDIPSYVESNSVDNINSGFGNTIELIDEDEHSEQSTNDDLETSLKDQIMGFDEYQQDLAKEDNTSSFSFNRISGNNLVGSKPIVCIKMSDMMKSYFCKDEFNSVIRQIFNLNIALNGNSGIDSCILQLGPHYNSTELGNNDLDDLVETLNSPDIELVGFAFTLVLDAIEEVVGSSVNKVIFIIYDRIIDKTASIKKMREMHSIFENNKVIFIQLDPDVSDNYESLSSKEETLFTNCRHILITKEVVRDNIKLATLLRNAFLD